MDETSKTFFTWEGVLEMQVKIEKYRSLSYKNIIFGKGEIVFFFLKGEKLLLIISKNEFFRFIE